MRDMLVKKQREKVNIVSKIQKHIKNKDWSCIIDGCSEKAINSHLLQRHGVLSEICNDRNKFYEIRTTNANKWSVNNLPIQFKLVGINEAISVPLFCRTHDTALFAEIEQNRIDFSNYRHQLLFCKRTAYSEIRKKEIANELYKRLLDAVNLNLTADDVKELQNSIKLNELGIEDIKKDIQYVEEELNNSKNSRFNFIHRTFSFQEIYATAIVSHNTSVIDAFSATKKPVFL